MLLPFIIREEGHRIHATSITKLLGVAGGTAVGPVQIKRFHPVHGQEAAGQGHLIPLAPADQAKGFLPGTEIESMDRYARRVQPQQPAPDPLPGFPQHHHHTLTGEKWTQHAHTPKNLFFNRFLPTKNNTFTPNALLPILVAPSVQTRCAFALLEC